MKKILLFVLVFILGSFTFLSAEVKIGVFDLQKIMIMSDAGKDIKSMLEKKKAYYQKIIKQKESQLKKMKEEIEKKAIMLSDTAKQEKEMEYQRKLRELKLYASDSENELKQLYATKTQKLIHDILKVARDYAKKNKFTILIERQEGGIVYFSKTIDVTNEILKEYNDFYKKQKENQ